MSADEVWKANREKVAFAKQFPGRLQSWDQAAGKKVEKAVQIPGRSAAVLLFDDRTFAVAAQLDPDPADLIQGLLAARSDLQTIDPDLFRKLDGFVDREKELLRRARLEKILGAVTNNMQAIPELKDELLKLLSKL
jgi:diglucosylglycerate octanoyltransferase